MRKILLIYEDFNELTSLEASLKKGGFDVIGLSTEYSLSEKMLSFRPDIVIASGRGPKVSTISVGKKLKDMTKWPGKSILIFPTGFKPNPQDLIKARMDLILESPIALNRMIQILAKLMGLAEQNLMDKINKISVAESEASRVGNSNYTPEVEEPVFVKGVKREKQEDSFALGSELDEAVNQAMKGTPGEKANTDSIFKSSTSADQTDPAEFSLKNRGEGEKSKNPFEQMAKELNSDKPEFKFDLHSPFDQVGQKEDKKFNGLDLNDESHQLKSAKDTDPEGELVNGEVGVDEKAFLSGAALKKRNENIRTQLQKAKSDSAARQARYNEYVKKDPPLSSKSTFQDRKAIKKAFKEMAKDWNKEDLEEQDRLRREFTSRLFKKTR
jgi:hypothetical protein